MAAVQEMACKKCRRITVDKVCNICGEPTSKEWQGCLIVADYEKSEIAERMGIRENGKYAIRVR